LVNSEVVIAGVFQHERFGDDAFSHVRIFPKKFSFLAE
jgi:hypothetical protein